MKRALRIGLWVLGAIVAVPLAYVLLVAVYNRFDEPLTPQAQALVQPVPVGGDPAANAYFMLLGLRAAPGEDAQALGIRLDKAAYDHFANAAAAAALPDDAALRGNATLGPEWGTKLRCNPFEKDCLAQRLALRAELGALLEQKGFLVERYQRILQLPDYRDRPMLGMNESMPTFSDFLDLDAYAQARIAVLVDEGREAEAWEQLGSAIAAARRVLAGSRQLITKMVFTRMLRDDLALLNALLARYPAFAPSPAQPLPAWLAPLTPAEISIAPALDAETRLIARTMLHFDVSTSLTAPSEQASGGGFTGLLSKLAFKRNATVNLVAGPQPPGTPVLPPSFQWPAGGLWNDYVDNPTGKILLAVASPDFAEYANRVTDAGGYLRLTALHWQLRQASLPDAQVPAFLEAHAGKYGDPYTGKPMQWDATARTLSFVGKGRAPVGQNVKDYRFVVVLGRP